MSIASVFAFVFETKGSQKVIGELQRTTKEERDTASQAEKLEKQQKNLGKSNLELAKSVTGLISSYVGFKKILSEVLGFAKGGEDLLLLANSAGVGAEQLERYGIALQNYGGGLSSAASTLSNLNQQLQDLKFGKGGAIQEAAIRYGVSLQGASGLATGEEFLQNIARRMQTLGRQEQLDLGRKLGLDPATIMLLQQGVAGLNEELAKAQEFTLYSKEDIENTRRFQMALREVKLSFQQVWGVVSRELLPIFEMIAKGMKVVFQYITEHKNFILGFLGSIATILLVISGSLLLTIGSIIAVGIAIGLLVDDIMAFIEGGDSMLGYIADGFEMFFLKLIEMDKALNKFFKELWQGIADTFISIWDAMVAKITGIIAWIAEKVQMVKSWIPFLGEDTDIAITAKQAIESTQTPLSTMPTSNVLNNANNSVKIDTVNVNTQATDAQGISQGIGGALSEEFEDVLFQNAGGAVA